MSPHQWYRRVLHGYRVGGHIGDALGGQLYEAQELSGSRAAVVELVDRSVASAPGFNARFERDVALLGSFVHPHVVGVLGAGHAEGVTYLVLDPLDGRTLSELVVMSGPLHPGRVAELVAQLAAALDAAHERGLVHRGLSPASIVVRERRAVEQAAIMDFGVADDTGMYGGLFERPSGTAPPPIDYAAPEQVRGDVAGAPADVYALGAILFHALTGRPPFTGLTPGATLEAHLHEPVPSARALVADLPAGFDDVFARALAKDPADRYPSACALAAALPSTRPALSSWRSLLASPPQAAEPEPLDNLTSDDTMQWDVEAEDDQPSASGPPSYHFLRARAYDPPVEAVTFGPEEPGLDDVAEDARAADVEDEIDLDDYDELPEDFDLGGFEGDHGAPAEVASSSSGQAVGSTGPDTPSGGDGALPAGAADAAAPEAASAQDGGPSAARGAGRAAWVHGRRGRRGRERTPPDLDPIDPPVRSARRRRRRRGPKPGLLIAAGLLLLATTAVLAAAGAFDDAGSPSGTRPTIATTANTQADALARLRGPRAKRSGGGGGAGASGTARAVKGAKAGATGTTGTAGTTAGSPATGAAGGTGTSTAGETATAGVDGAGGAAGNSLPAALSWPAGRSAYTAVVYVSPTDRATALQRARRAARLGVRTGVLRSSDYANLVPGMWVAFVGISDSESQAQRTADRLRAAGLAPTPYTRFVKSR